MALKPRIDKSDPKVGSFRAGLAADFPDADINKVWAFGLNSSGLAVKGAGVTGVLGVVIRTKKGEKAGDVIDIHTAGELFPFVETDGTALAPGKKYYGQADGSVDDVATGVLLGWATSDGRLVLRVGHTDDAVVARVVTLEEA